MVPFYREALSQVIEALGAPNEEQVRASKDSHNLARFRGESREGTQEFPGTSRQLQGGRASAPGMVRQSGEGRGLDAGRAAPA